MKFLTLKVALLSLLLNGCAEPKYLNEGSLSPISLNEKLLANCELQLNLAPQYCVNLKWEVPPSESSPGTLLLRLFLLDPSDGFPVLIQDEPEVAVVLWMPTMNHGSSPTQVERIGPGTYRISRMYFTMRGEWEIKLQILEDGAKADELVLPFSL